jgi:predicted translin family RNA/ssDNA-binding protein
MMTLVTTVNHFLKFTSLELLLSKLKSKIQKHNDLYHSAVKQYCLISDIIGKMRSVSDTATIEQIYNQACQDYQDYVEVTNSKKSLSFCTH